MPTKNQLTDDSAALAESTQLMCDLTVAYYNGTKLRATRKDVERMILVASKAELHGPDLIGDALNAVLCLKGGKHFGKALNDLARDRSKFRKAVEWLCSSKEPDDADGPFLRYFQYHGMKHVKRELAVQHGGKIVLRSKHLHLVDLFCVFLVNECVGQRPSMMPVKVCPRCRQLFSVAQLRGRARVRKEHCSAKCQESSHWTKGREARADLRYVSRLIEEYSPGDRRRRLENPKVKDRLDEISKRWVDRWPTLMQKLQQVNS
jgi:hypothetical protein